MKIRKVHTKQNSNSLLFNIPLEFAHELNLIAGDYLTIIKDGKKIILSKLDLPVKENFVICKGKGENHG